MAAAVLASPQPIPAEDDDGPAASERKPSPEPLDETTTNTEVDINLEGEDAAKLMPQTSEDTCTLFQGLLCMHAVAAARNDEDVVANVDGEEKTSKPICLSVALKAAQLGFEVYRNTVAENEGANGDFAEKWSKVFVLEFMQAKSAWEESTALGNGQDTLHPASILEEFKENNPFTDGAFSKVASLTRYDLSSASSISKCFERISEDVQWDVPLLAIVLACEGETILCFRARVVPSVYNYLIADCHARPDLGRGPALIACAKSKPAAEYLYDIWKNLPSTGSDGETEFSGHIIRPNSPNTNLLESEVEDAPPPPYPQALPTESDTQDHPPVPPSHSPPPLPHPSPPPEFLTQEKEEPTSSNSATSSKKAGKRSKQKVQVDSLRSQSSKNRLQSEFGWQMGLQSRTIISPLRKAIGDEPAMEKDNPDPNLNKDEKAEDAPTQSPAPRSPTPPPSENPPMPNLMTATTRFTRDLSKKDIGWQLALQEQVGGITLPSKAELHRKNESNTNKDSKGAPAGSISENAKPSGSKASSTASLSQQSGGSSDKLRSPSGLESSSQADLERQKPVRDDIGWQLGLAAKSLTFPIQNNHGTPGSPSNNDHTLATPTSHTVGLGEPSPSLLFATSEFGAFQAIKATANDTSTPPTASVDCHYCFGTYTASELIRAGDMEACAHKVCRDCLRRHILDHLENHRFPIPCPACTLLNRIRPSYLGHGMLGILGFSEAEVDKYDMLEFQTQPVPVSCPKCTNRESHTRNSLVANRRLRCSSCSHEWCRSCHKDLDNSGGSIHVCRDYKRDKVLGKRPGRFCPGCQTFVSSKSGHNNRDLECSSTCGMHFCYKCGDAIADLAKGENPDRLSFAHLQTCIAQPEAGGSKTDKCNIQ